MFSRESVDVDVLPSSFNSRKCVELLYFLLTFAKNKYNESKSNIH